MCRNLSDGKLEQEIFPDPRNFPLGSEMSGMLRIMPVSLQNIELVSTDEYSIGVPHPSQGVIRIKPTEKLYRFSYLNSDEKTSIHLIWDIRPEEMIISGKDYKTYGFFTKLHSREINETTYRGLPKAKDFEINKKW